MNTVTAVVFKLRMWRVVFTSLLVVLSISETRAFTSSCAGLASSYASANPGCSLSPDCTELKCSWAGGKQVELMVFNCEDPVRVVLNLQDFDQHCNRTYAVSGDGTYDDVALGGQVLHVFHSRNTSHLHFMAYTVSGSSSSMIIPSVDIPLAPDKCMHDDFEDAARNFHLPPPLVESCTAETNICRGFHCNFTGSGETYSTCITIEPCNETLQITITDSLEQVQYDEVFSNNRSVVLHPRVGPDFTLMVHMHQYNYSMDAELSVIVDNIPVRLLPHRHFILDRTNCSPFIPYPAAPASVATPMLCSAPPPQIFASCKDLAAGYASSNHGCNLSSDCLQVQCSPAGKKSADLVIFNCEDPVRAVFILNEPAGHCSRTYDVSGPDQINENLLEGENVTVIYSRNASHLQFSASLSGSGGSSVIPAVDIPLLPGKCLYGDFVNTSRNILLPPPWTQFCVAETNKCGGVLCNFTAPTESYKTCITVDSCNETIQIVIHDSQDNSVFDEIFSQSRSIPLRPTLAPPFTLYVILDHYNYSMEATMLIAVQLPLDVNITILPKQRFILDRTKCNPFKSYPAAPDKWGTPMVCHAPVTTTPSTSVPSNSRLALAITIPVVLVVMILTAAAVIVALLLVQRHFKKRSEVGFRRIAFNDDDTDDDDDD